ncbi:MAG: hypothetical protein R2830_09485 [Saprospiraceae bacterium]
MENSRLTALLQTLDRKEQRELRKFIASPYFNQRQDVADLFEVLVKCINDNQPLPGKEETHRLLYGPGEVFDDHKVRMAMSFLLKLAEQYLVQRAFFEDSLAVKTKLAAIYRQRNLPRHFERTMREAQEGHRQQQFRNAGFHARTHRMLTEQFRFNLTQRRMVDYNLQAITDHLDVAYFAQKLRQTCTLLSHQAVYKKEYDFGLLQAVLRHIEEQNLTAHPAIAVYYYCYQSLVQPDDPAYFHQLKNLLVTEGDKFPPDEISDLYLLAINYCIRQYNKGGHGFLADEFDLYKEGLKKGYLLSNGTLSRFTYRNAVTVGLALKEFDWVEIFLREFKSKLEKGQQQSMYSFNLARLEFERQHFGSALQLLQKTTFDDILLDLAARALILKIFYEMDAHDALESHLDAMQRFIRRKEVISYHGEHYLNLAQFTRRLMEAQFDKKALEALKADIEKTEAVAERNWLLRQVPVNH